MKNHWWQNFGTRREISQELRRKKRKNHRRFCTTRFHFDYRVRSLDIRHSSLVCNLSASGVHIGVLNRVTSQKHANPSSRVKFTDKNWCRLACQNLNLDKHSKVKFHRSEEVQSKREDQKIEIDRAIFLVFRHKFSMKYLQKPLVSFMFAFWMKMDGRK